MKKVMIIDGGGAYQNLFVNMGFQVVKMVHEADLVVFTGGADVTPSYYGHAKHHSTHSDAARDEYESGIFQVCLQKKIPMVGICRGGQLLNVLSGGEMYQDVSKHGMSHHIVDLETGETIYVSSTHHQMMKPYEKGLLVATSNQGGSREWWDGQVFTRNVSEEDVEVVWYEHTKSLCFQPHPEFYGSMYIGMHTYFETLLKRFIFK